ncbi:hypothetical protein [Caballeronia sp. ATUFL_F1_KS39]|uniref:hypothetical protein n=1 Tax=Caballeronia sp. ATUFL_F1_KS39 TaxID=2921766 RepID=UPI002027CA07|nr:hypothetical protein [Caballeronia sp. ATUFL_F1_KS39]
MNTYLPPARLKDFDKSAKPQDMYDAWHRLMSDAVNVEGYPAAFDALELPAMDEAVQQAAPIWFGLPRTIKRMTSTISEAAAMVEHPIAMGGFDPLAQGNFTVPFRDSMGKAVPGQWYRPQDEYLEWVTRTDSDGVVTEVEFTCEGPEYWNLISQDDRLVVDMYQEICHSTAITIDDLVFPKDLIWTNPNEFDPNTRKPVSRTYKKGDYNPYNIWNSKNAVHLTQTANTLGAEIRLAQDATKAYGVPNRVTDDPALACCAAYGGINRMSDPTIGHAVNQQVIQFGRRVALRNPIGLYIAGLVDNQLSLNGAPFPDQAACWTVLRPGPAEVTDMIVRARFAIPPGTMHQGKQLRVGDLTYKGEQIKYGGQIADFVQMTLYAIAVSGAPAQNAIPCKFSPCPTHGHPELITAVPFGQPCHATAQQSLLAAGFVLPPSDVVSLQPSGGLIRASHR